MLTQPLPRRRLLKLFVKTGVLFSGASLASQLAGCGGDESQDNDAVIPYDTEFGKLLMLDEAHSNILFAFAQASLSGADQAIHRARVIQRIDEELYFVAEEISSDFLLALDVLEYLPLAYGCFSRFSKMPLNERSALLVSLQHTSVNTVSAVLNACRMAVMMMFYGHESNWSAIHYDGTFSHMPQIMSAERLRYQQLTQTRPSDEGGVSV